MERAHYKCNISLHLTLRYPLTHMRRYSLGVGPGANVGPSAM